MSISLEVGGITLSGWKTVQVTRGIERAAGSFRFTMSDGWPGNEVSPPVTIGADCRVLVDGERVMTGRIGRISSNFDATSGDITVSGLSKVATLVKSCILEAKPFKERRPIDIISELIDPFGITVKAMIDTGGPITVKPRQGDTVFGVISDIANMGGFLVFDDADGNLVLDRVGSKRASQALIRRDEQTNILRGGVEQSDEERYSLYRVVGQTPRTDFNTAEEAAGPSATVADENVQYYSPLVLIAEQAADTAYCQARAVWERARRAGNSISAKYDVNGWRQSSGELWMPNLVTAIEDEKARLKSSMVASEITWALTEGGEITSMSFAPTEAYALEPTIAKASDNSAFFARIEEAGKNAKKAV